MTKLARTVGGTVSCFQRPLRDTIQISNCLEVSGGTNKGGHKCAKRMLSSTRGILLLMLVPLCSAFTTPAARFEASKIVSSRSQRRCGVQVRQPSMRSSWVRPGSVVPKSQNGSFMQSIAWSEGGSLSFYWLLRCETFEWRFCLRFVLNKDGQTLTRGRRLLLLEAFRLVFCPWQAATHNTHNKRTSIWLFWLFGCLLARINANFLTWPIFLALAPPDGLSRVEGHFRRVLHFLATRWHHKYLC